MKSACQNEEAKTIAFLIAAHTAQSGTLRLWFGSPNTNLVKIRSTLRKNPISILAFDHIM
jgi:hypothetical protein